MPWHTEYAVVSVQPHDKNFAAVLWAPDDVIRQVEYGTTVLGVAAVFWLLQKHTYTADIYPSQLGQFQVVVRLACRLKAIVRRLFRYRSSRAVGESDLTEGYLRGRRFRKAPSV